MIREFVSMQLKTQAIKVMQDNGYEGISSYDPKKSYNIDTFCVFAGILHKSKIDNNISNVPSNYMLKKWLPERLYENISFEVKQSANEELSDGSITKPFAFAQSAVDILPKNIDSCDVVINIDNGIYDADLRLENFYGTGSITIKAKNKGEAKLKSICVTNCACKIFIDGIVLNAKSENGSMFYVSNSEKVKLENCKAIGNTDKTAVGVLLEKGKLSVIESYFENCLSCFNIPYGKNEPSILFTNLNTGTANVKGFDINGGILFRSEGNTDLKASTDMIYSASALIIRGSGGIIGAWL